MGDLKRIQLLVDGVEYACGEFAEVVFASGPNGVRFEARPASPPRRSSGSGLLEMLTSASKARTESVRQEKLAEAEIVTVEDGE